MNQFSASDIERLLPMPVAIDSQAEAFRLLSEGRVVSPLRQSLSIGKGSALFMPAQAGEFLGAKIVTIFPENAKSGRPTIQGLVVIFRTSDGTPCASVDGTSLTAWRTGAASGVATRFLARADVKIGGVIGIGAQAETQLLAICSARDLAEVHIFGRDSERVGTFLRKMQPQVSAKLIRAKSVEALASVAGVICTATSSDTPVLFGRWVRPGTHINAIGAYRPTGRELDSELVSAARLFLDSKASAMEEAGDLLIPIQEGSVVEEAFVELGDVISGEKPGRESETEITVFKSVGCAVQDVVAAGWLYRRATEKVS